LFPRGGVLKDRALKPASQKLFAQIAKFTRKQAFTLAEVLITLAIIGIIAAITIPSIIANHQKRTLETQFAKTYRTLTQMVNLATAEHGGLVSWEWKESYSSNEYVEIFNKNFAKYLNIAKFCPPQEAAKAQCLPDTVYKFLDGTDYANFKGWANPKMILADGSALMFGIMGAKYNIPKLYFLVDINGFKKPNMIGRDMFWFIYYPDTAEFLPRGVYKWDEIDEETGEYKRLPWEEVLQECSTDDEGLTCAARIITEGFKMNY